MDDPKLRVALEVVQNENIKVNIEDFDTMYQCEFCEFICEEKSKMLSHLNEEVHSSASFVCVTPNKEVKYVVELSALKCPKAFYSKMVLVCPEHGCYELHTDAHQCAIHFAKHNPENINAYGVVDVEVSETASCHIEKNICDECGYELNTIIQLNRHFDVSGHEPYAMRPECTMRYVCLQCPAAKCCNVSRYHMAVTHVRNHFNSKKKKLTNPFVQVLVLSLSNDKKKVEFQPYPAR